MRRGRVQAFGAAALAAALLGAPRSVQAESGPLRHVTASLVRLRAEPLEDAPEVARLRIAAPVRLVVRLTFDEAAGGALRSVEPGRRFHEGRLAE
jgi:hypothetical protein